GTAAADEVLGVTIVEAEAPALLVSAGKRRGIEAPVLLQRVVDQIDAPLFAFAPATALRLVNPAGEHLLRLNRTRMMGRKAAEIELQECLTATNETVVELNVGESQAR